MAHKRDDLRRDLAGVGPDPQMAGHLSRMSNAKDFKIAEGEPDIRGWEVRTLAGTDVGQVDDLLIDPHRGEVVMLDIDLNDSDQHVHIPIRGVQLDRGRNCVIVDSGDVRTARESLIGDKLAEGNTRAAESEADARVGDERQPEVHYGRTPDDATTEEVIERRPVIEEVVVRRRVADEE